MFSITKIIHDGIFTVNIYRYAKIGKSYFCLCDLDPDPMRGQGKNQNMFHIYKIYEMNWNHVMECGNMRRAFLLVSDLTKTRW